MFTVRLDEPQRLTHRRLAAPACRRELPRAPSAGSSNDRVEAPRDRGHQQRAHRRRSDGRDPKPAFARSACRPGGRRNDSEVFRQVRSGANGFGACSCVGVFISRDPLDGQDGTPTVSNPYHYTNNDPPNSTDPSGLRPREIGFGGGLTLLDAPNPLCLLGALPAIFCLVTRGGIDVNSKIRDEVLDSMRSQGFKNCIVSDLPSGLGVIGSCQLYLSETDTVGALYLLRQRELDLRHFTDSFYDMILYSHSDARSRIGKFFYNQAYDINRAFGGSHADADAKGNTARSNFQLLFDGSTTSDKWFGNRIRPSFGSRAFEVLGLQNVGDLSAAMRTPERDLLPMVEAAISQKGTGRFASEHGCLRATISFEASVSNGTFATTKLGIDFNIANWFNEFCREA